MTDKGRHRYIPSMKMAIALVGVAALLAGLGYATKPQWQPWWYAMTICDGNLSGSDLADVLSKKQLSAGKEVVDTEGRRLKCSVDIPDSHHYELSVTSTADSEKMRQDFDMAFTIAHEPRYVFPKNIPGFASEFGPTVIQECPALGRDSQGRKVRLLTTFMGRKDDTAAALRITVAMANGASQKLGCGAERLPLPKQTLPKNLPAVPVQEARDTMCGWLADAPLPKNKAGGPWLVAAPTDDHAPITDCKLIAAKDTAPVADFSGWYGGWTDKPFTELLRNNVDYPENVSPHGPMMSEAFGRATAACDGESANFKASSHASRSEEQISSVDLRALLSAFAKDQAKRHSCTDLKLPDTIYPALKH
ncbi:hypothetical protein CTZ27_16275 [Streptomyces griseocarneus]|nr:hypothetical protein CTZ27_16275 [Streptomyces griseocarneus]